MMEAVAADVGSSELRRTLASLGIFEEEVSLQLPSHVWKSKLRAKRMATENSKEKPAASTTDVVPSSSYTFAMQALLGSGLLVFKQ